MGFIAQIHRAGRKKLSGAMSLATEAPGSAEGKTAQLVQRLLIALEQWTMCL